jgi:hypothetical protein
LLNGPEPFKFQFSSKHAQMQGSKMDGADSGCDQTGNWLTFTPLISVTSTMTNIYDMLQEDWGA